MVSLRVDFRSLKTNPYARRGERVQGLGKVVERRGRGTFCTRDGEIFGLKLSKLDEPRAWHSPKVWAFPRVTSETYKLTSESIHELPPLAVKSLRVGIRPFLELVEPSPNRGPPFPKKQA